LSLSNSTQPTAAPKWTRRLIFVLAAASAAYLGISFVSERLETRQLERDQRDLASTESVARAQKVDQSLAPLKPLVLSLAKDVGSGQWTGAALTDRLREVVEKSNGLLIEAGVAFAGELNAPHYFQHNGVHRAYQRETYGDYRERQWFTSAMNQGVSWSEPEVGHGSGEFIVGVGASFRLNGASPQGPPSGVVRVNTSVGALQDIIAGLTAGSTHYGYLLSAHGTYLSHPIAAYVQELKTVFETTDNDKDRSLQECVRKAMLGQRGEGTGTSQVNQHPVWIFCEPVPVNHWVLVMMYETAELLAPTAHLRLARLHTLLGLIATLSLLGFLLLRVERVQPARLWAASMLVTLLLAAGISVLWGRLRKEKVPRPSDSLALIDQGTLRQYEEQHDVQIGGLKEIKSIYVPAGILVSTLNFPRPGEATVTGYAWQRYRKGQEDLARGFVFPDAEQASFQEAFHRTQGDEEVIGWSFRANLRQSYSDTSRYPFDGAALRFRLWHKDFDRSVVLAPDLDAYTLLMPSSLPGLAEELNLPGWEIQQTFFDFAPTRIASDFGIQTFTGQVGAPELGFNIIAKREFLDPFFASIMPIAVVDAILFILLLCVTMDEKVRDRLGFKPMNALSVAAGTLFVILVAHNNMRGRIAATQIVFLELFYFLAYASIILVAVNAIAVTRARPVGFVRAGDNLAAKIGFWPVSLLALLVITVAVFY
jgi:hypothetical protein